MTTAEIEHTHWAKRFRFCRSEDTLIATLASWTVGLFLFTLAGFYVGTIAGHDNHPNQQPNLSSSIYVSTAPAGSPWRVPGQPMHKDLDPAQLMSALPFAAVGLLIGVVFAIYITAVYVPTKLRELESEQGHH